MLVHPEVYAWLNRQNRTNLEERKSRPLVTKAEKINKGGPEKAHDVQQYAPEETDREHEVEYLNDRKSSLSFYA